VKHLRTKSNTVHKHLGCFH